MNTREKIISLLLAFVMFVLICPRINAMSSTNFIINWDSINAGGTDYSSSTNYSLSDTLGEIGTGRSSSTNYWIYAGYRQGIRDPGFLSLDIAGQDNASKVSYSAFNNAGLQVTVSSVVGYSAGDYIAVAENEGASQMVALGRIANVGGLTITVDKWDGDNAAMSAIPGGGDDWVYKLTGHAVDLGSLSVTAVRTGVSRTEVTTNAENGYTVSVKSDGELRNGADDINKVTDGAVSLGNEEYGIETVGTYASGTNDFALNETGQAIQVRSAAGSSDRVGVIYKAAIDYATQGGSYSQIVSFYLTANF
jgi:hypothetical protein